MPPSSRTRHFLCVFLFDEMDAKNVNVKEKKNIKKYYLPSEVVLHNKETDIWVMFLGKVWDITSLVAEFKGTREVKPLLAFAGKDISHWFDERTEDIKYVVHPVTGVKVPYCPYGPIPHVPAQVPTSKWQPLEAVKRPYDGLPWWRNKKYVVGYLTSNARPIKFTQSITPNSNILAWVASEHSLGDIVKKIISDHSRLENYTLKFQGRQLRLDKTLDENVIPDMRRKFKQLSLPDNCYVPAIQLYYDNDNILG